MYYMVNVNLVGLRLSSSLSMERNKQRHDFILQTILNELIRTIELFLGL